MSLKSITLYDAVPIPTKEVFPLEDTYQKKNFSNSLYVYEAVNINKVSKTSPIFWYIPSGTKVTKYKASAWVDNGKILVLGPSTLVGLFPGGQLRTIYTTRVFSETVTNVFIK